MPDTPENTSAAGPSAQPASTNNAYPKGDDDPSVPSPPFHELVMLLEDIAKRRTDKNQLLRKYFTVTLQQEPEVLLVYIPASCTLDHSS